jgi:hypothetical protein
MLRRDNLILVLILVYYCLPKIDLFFIPGSLTGIRVQDFIALVVFFALFRMRIRIKPTYIFFLLSAHTLYSATIWGNFQGVLGVFRFVEYYAIGLGLYYLATKDLFAQFVKLVLTFLACFGLLQFFLIVPNFDPGRGLQYSREFSGSFGTPAELSYFVLAVLYFLNLIYKRMDVFSWVSLLVLANGVKAVVVGFLVIHWVNIKSLNLVIGMIFGIFMVLLVYFARESAFAAWEFLGIVLENITTANATFSDLKSGGGIRVDEASLSHRIGKWTNSLSVMYQYPMGSLFGFGIYSQGGALDGGILRFIYEFGLFIFTVLMIHLSRLSITFVLILFSVNFLFDGYMSSVVMPILLATYLYLRAERASDVVV